MLTESALPDPGPLSGSPVEERLLKYRSLVMAFRYPDDKFFTFFSECSSERQEITAAYDRFFRVGIVWLYGLEYLTDNEFQRATQLADIMGFYKAFGVEPDIDRADALSNELEFMHYLIFKEQHALRQADSSAAEKAAVCQDAQEKFFAAHLMPAGEKIIDKICECIDEGFYREAAIELRAFLESEKELLIKEGVE